MENYKKLVKEVDEGLSNLYRALQGILEAQRAITEDIRALKEKREEDHGDKGGIL